MSKKETENGEQKKALTKYDLKMQRRENERKKEKREELISRIAGIAIVAALACLVASFPIRSYLTVNGTFIEVAGEKVSRVEFDYYYNLVKNNYLAQNSYYLSMFGMDLSGDLSTVMYDNTLSFQDYFEQMAVQSIAENKALRDQMKAAGFTYDASEEYAEYEQALKEAAAAEGMTEKVYIQQVFGRYATASRLKGYIQEGMALSAYTQRISEEKEPSEADIQAYYEENADSYDVVDYYLLTVNAELPTEPTDLADPKDPAQEDQETEGTDADAAYQPSEAEIAFAMEKAKTEADAALEEVSKTGELLKDMKNSSLPSLIRDWLFDSARKAGDATVIENTAGHLYYVVEFAERRLNQDPTVDARVIMVGADAETGAEAILEEWKSGAATEESFGELADKYGASVEGGLYEGLKKTGMTDSLGGWLFDGARTSGETAVITGGENEGSYVVYYMGENKPEWFLSIRNTLLSERMNAYLEEISQGYDVTNARGNLKYVKLLEAQEAQNNGSVSGN